MSNKKEKKLSTEELRHKERLDALCRKMKHEGYNVQNLFNYKLETVGAAIFLPAPFALLLSYFYVSHNADIRDSMFPYCLGVIFAYFFTFLSNIRHGVSFYPFNLFFFLLISLVSLSGTLDNFPLFVLTCGILPYICSILLYEEIHKRVLSLFTKGGKKDVEAVMSFKRLTSFYITITPLSKRDYICVALIPLALTLFLGIIASYLFCLEFYIFAQTMIFLSGHDLWLLCRLLLHRADGDDIQYLDHPYECGLVAFVKKTYQK